MKIRNIILLALGLLPFFAASQTATFDRVRVRQGITIRAEKADSIIRAVTALSNHTSIPTAKAVWDAIAATVTAAKYQTLRDDGSSMTQRAAANFVSTSTVAMALTDDSGNNETEIRATIPALGVTSTELAASSVNSSKIRDTTIVAGDIKNATITSAKLANSGVSAGSYPSTNSLVAIMSINAQGQVTGVTQVSAADPSITNEGSLSVGSAGGGAAVYSNTNGGDGVIFKTGNSGLSIVHTDATPGNRGILTFTNTGDTSSTNDLTVSDTVRTVSVASTHSKYPTALAVYNAITAATAGVGGGPDSTWAKSPSGSYAGKRITDNVYREGKTGIGTTDTTAMLNLKPKNPVATVRTFTQKISAPPRSAFSDPVFANGSYLDVQDIDINPAKPNHYTGFNYGVWRDQMTVDSTTNLFAGRPGNHIRNVGFNLDGASPTLSRWYWSTEQHYVNPGDTRAVWESHLEVFDTLGRQTRVAAYNGTHNGNSYGVGFSANDFYLSRPHNSGYLLRIRGNDANLGEWHTDYPYTFRINNDTRIGRVIERLHSGTHRNVLDWTTSGRLDVGDLGGIRLDNRLIIGGSNGLPKILSETTNLRFDSTEMYIRTSGNRHIRMETYASSDYFDIGFDNTQVFFRGSGSTIPMLCHKSAPNYSLGINSTGRVGLGLSSAYSTLDIQQHTNGLDGGLRLVPVTGDYFGLFVNSDNEVAFNRGGANRMFLTNSGQLKMPSYTSTSSYTITPAGLLGFNSAGDIGTVAGITGTDLTFSGTSSPVTLNSSTGTDVTFTAGTGITLAATGTNQTITNSAPDQTVSLTNGGGVAVSGTYPSFTLTATDQSISNEGSLTVDAGSGTTSIINSNTSGSTGVTLTAGTGLTISESGNTITLASTATGDITNGGNTTGAAITVGTNDAFGLNLETNNITRVAITGAASTGGAMTLTDVTATTNAVENALTIQANSTGTAATSFGPGILFQGESSTTNNRDMGRVSALWTTATDASRASKIGFSTVTGAGALTERAFIGNLGLTVGNTVYQSGIINDNSGDFRINSNNGAMQINSGTGWITLNSSGSTSKVLLGITAYNSPTLAKTELNSGGGFASYTAASGSGTYTTFEINPTFNLTGTANGIQRGISIAPTLTSLVSTASYRAVDIAVNATNAFGIHQSGTLTTNIFAGRTAVGSTTAPTALVHLAAGTATESTAPIKFTSGTNLTAVENGAVEYDGTNYFVSSGSTRHTLAKTLTATGALDFPSTANQTSSDLTITVTGAVAGDVAFVGVPNSAVATGTQYSAWVSTTNQVTVRLLNSSGGLVDPGSATFRVSVLRY
jgi:hypothetical protein